MVVGPHRGRDKGLHRREQRIRKDELSLGEAQEPYVGKFVHLLRRREHLPVDQFAEAVDIELSDAQATEEEPFYRVDFRTIWAISRRFGLPQGKPNEIAGVVMANDAEPFINQQRYAARWEFRTALSTDELHGSTF